MTDDILKSAISSLPEEPAPHPEIESTQPSSVASSPTRPQDAPTIVDTLLETKQPDPIIVPSQEHTSHHQPIHPKSSGKGPLLALIALLLFVLPVSVFFISKQNQQLSDIRSKAKETEGNGCGNGCPDGYTCSTNLDGTDYCKKNPGTPPSDGGGGNDCESDNNCNPGYRCNDNHKCVASTPTYPPDSECGRNVDTGAPVCCTAAQIEYCNANQNKRVCEPPNRLECNYSGDNHCTLNVDGCTGDTPPDDTPPTSTPKPTSTVTPIALSYCLLSGGCAETTAIYNPTTLKDQWGNSCEYNLAQYRAGLYTGGCYKTVAACNAACAKPSATPTSPAGACQDIKIYQGNTQINPSTLRAGDQVKINIKGSGGPTKARYRINGSAWTEVVRINGTGEFYIDYVIPAGITDFVIEGEVFVNGAWR